MAQGLDIIRAFCSAFEQAVSALALEKSMYLSASHRTKPPHLNLWRKKGM